MTEKRGKGRPPSASPEAVRTRRLVIRLSEDEERRLKAALVGAGEVATAARELLLQAVDDYELQPRWRKRR